MRCATHAVRLVVRAADRTLRHALTHARGLPRAPNIYVDALSLMRVQWAMSVLGTFFLASELEMAGKW